MSAVALNTNWMVATDELAKEFPHCRHKELEMREYRTRTFNSRGCDARRAVKVVKMN